MFALDGLAGDIAELRGEICESKLELRCLAGRTKWCQLRGARAPGLVCANTEQRDAQQGKQDQQQYEFISCCWRWLCGSRHPYLSVMIVELESAGKKIPERIVPEVLHSVGIEPSVGTAISLPPRWLGAPVRARGRPGPAFATIPSTLVAIDRTRWRDSTKSLPTPESQDC